MTLARLMPSALAMAVATKLSDRGGERAAIMFTLIQTCKLNDIDPQAWFADMLARIADHNIHSLDRLLPWNWKLQPARLAA